jgi:hypothetical protein
MCAPGERFVLDYAVLEVAFLEAGVFISPNGDFMSFLDNLENSLNSLENTPIQEDAGREKDRRKLEIAEQNAVAPWAERLKKSPYTQGLMSTATREGYKLRTKVYITWLGSTLRLEARERRLDLRPAINGVLAIFSVNAEQIGSRLMELQGDPSDLVHEWLG